MLFRNYFQRSKTVSLLIFYSAVQSFVSSINRNCKPIPFDSGEFKFYDVSAGLTRKHNRTKFYGPDERHARGLVCVLFATCGAVNRSHSFGHFFLVGQFIMSHTRRLRFIYRSFQTTRTNRTKTNGTRHLFEHRHSDRAVIWPTINRRVRLRRETRPMCILRFAFRRRVVAVQTHAKNSACVFRSFSNVFEPLENQKKKTTIFTFYCQVGFDCNTI